MYVIEDEIHAEPVGQFTDRDQAITELRRLAGLRWDQEPNRAPCMSWRTCGRRYELVEYDMRAIPWRTIQRLPALDISHKATIWLL